MGHDTYQQDKKQLSSDFKQKTQAVYTQIPAKNWQDWLIQKATQGDKPALDALRQNRHTQKLTERFALWGEKEKAGMHILKHLKPTVRKNGDVLYQAMGVTLRDTGKRLALDNNDDTAILTALRLARSKYGDHLDVQGDDVFKQKVVEAAVATGMPVTFADPAMEQRRKVLSGVSDNVRAEAVELKRLERERKMRELAAARTANTPPSRPRGGEGR